MRSTLLVGLFSLVPTVAMAQQPFQAWGGQPGSYEVHTWHHRSNNFERAPYFATNPPVYYGDQRLVRSYGWTPYPFFGRQYSIDKAVTPMAENEEGQPMPAKPKKKAKKEAKDVGA